MAILTLEETKNWLRVDIDDDDNLILMLIGAAETYLNNACGGEFDETNQLAKLFCLVLVSDWYENRELVGQTSDKVRFICQSILSQLQHSYSLEE